MMNHSTRSVNRIFVIMIVIALSTLAVSAERATVGVQDNVFSPSTVTIGLGNSVQWTNNDANPHTVTSDTNVFDSGRLNQGQIFTRTFDRTGTFPYHCTFHQGMNGRVIVVEVTGEEEEEIVDDEPDDPGAAGRINEFLRYFLSGVFREEPAEESGIEAVIDVREAFTPLPKIIVTFDEPVSLMTGKIFFIQVKKPDVETITENNLPPNGFIDIIDGIPSKETRERWFLEPSHSLPPGFYVVELQARDMVGNSASFRHFFSVDYETMDIRVTKPPLGASRERDFIVEVGTSKNDAPLNTMCKYSRRDQKYRFFTVGMVSSNMFGPRHEFPSLTREPFIDLTPNRRGNEFFLICQTPQGEVGQATAEIYVDTEPPTIMRAVFEPTVIVEIPDDHHFFSELVVETNEDAQCKYALQGGLSFQSMTPFADYQRNEFHAYKKTNRQRIELPEPETRLTKVFFVRCEDRTGQTSQEVPVPITIDLTQPIQIDISSPPSASDNNAVSLNFTTNKVSRCYYTEEGKESVFLEDEFNPSKTHSADLGTREDGRHTIQVTCESTTAGTVQRSVKEHLFMIDTSTPAAPSFNGSTTSCDPDKFNLDITVRADDPQSGIRLFRYFVAETEKNGTFGAPGGVGKLPRIPAQEQEGEKPTAFTHTVIVSAINNVGLEGPATPLVLNYDPLHPTCIEHDPPEVALQKRSSPGTVEIRFICDDESGCDDNTFYYGLGGENLLGLTNVTEMPAEECIPSNLVDKNTPVTIHRTRSVCWNVKDLVGNEAEGSEKVVVSLPQTCTNQVTDGDETGIDCGGACGNLCEEGESCNMDYDCLGEYCVEGRCVPPRCDDQRKNGDETDLDCGGVVCTRCDLEKGCERGDDCTSGYCAVSTKTCTLPTCTDAAVNGNETDVDCGGTCETKCAAGRGCKVIEDCASGICSFGRCDAVPGTPTEKPVEKKPSALGVFITSNLLFIIGILLIGGGAGYLAFSSPTPSTAKPALITHFDTATSAAAGETKKQEQEAAQRRHESRRSRQHAQTAERQKKKREFFNQFQKAVRPITKAVKRPLELLRPFHAAARTGVQQVARAAEKVEKIPKMIADGEWIPLGQLQKKQEQKQAAPRTSQKPVRQEQKEKAVEDIAFEKNQDDVFGELEKIK